MRACSKSAHDWDYGSLCWWEIRARDWRSSYVTLYQRRAIEGTVDGARSQASR